MNDLNNSTIIMAQHSLENVYLLDLGLFNKSKTNIHVMLWYQQVKELAEVFFVISDIFNTCFYKNVSCRLPIYKKIGL